MRSLAVEKRFEVDAETVDAGTKGLFRRRVENERSGRGCKG